MPEPHILIVEDEQKLAQLLADYFNQSQITTTQLHRGDEVEPWLAANTADAIVLDLMLPGKDGLQICKDIRATSDIPILMVTARVEEIDRLIGLEFGADDYICKPYSPREVVARVKAVLRRCNATTQKTATALQLDEHQLRVNLGSEQVELTGIEFGILALLAKEPGRIFSRDQLMATIYADHRVVSDRTIDSHVKKLRKKLSPLSQNELIQSVYGVGYRFVFEGV